jgi:ABC-type branched-subunit amino acid transport system substrate-binding protein
VYWQKSLGIKDVAIGVVQTATGAAAAQQVQSVIQGIGDNYKGTISFPLTTQDYAPVAQQLQATGAQGVILITGSVLTPSIIQAAAQIGYKPAWASSTAGTPPALAQKYASVLQGIYLGGGFPPANASIPAMANFRADAAGAQQRGVPAANQEDDPMVQAWLMIQALATVGNTLKKGTPVTGATMIEALSKAHNVNLSGLGTWNPAGPGLPTAPRVTNGNAFLVQVQSDGSYKLVTPNAINVFTAAHLTQS